MSQSTNLIRLSAVNNDPRIGGFLITYPSSYVEEVSWVSDKKVTDTLKEAKLIAARLVQNLIERKHNDDLERTNWASVVAAIQRIISDWGDRLPNPRTAVEPGTTVH